MIHPLKKRRSELGLSQVDAAKRLGVSRQYLGLLERGKKAPSWKLALRAAKELGVDPVSIMPAQVQL